MNQHSLSRLAQATALILLVGLVYALGARPTAWASATQYNRGTVPPRQADLSLRYSGSWSGNEVRLSIRASNAGPVVAEKVVITSSVPSQLNIQHVSSSSGRCSVSGQQVRCTLNDLRVSSSISITIKTRPADSRVRQVTSSGSVSSATTDPNTANNSASVTVRK